jgi:hypothetical protein
MKKELAEKKIKGVASIFYIREDGYMEKIKFKKADPDWFVFNKNEMVIRLMDIKIKIKYKNIITIEVHK